MSLRIVSILWFAPLFLQAQTPDFKLQQFALGNAGVVDITHCGDSRLFLARQDGYIRIVDSTGKYLIQPFLDIKARVLNGAEQGLLGLAFHPNYARNGWFFVNYTKSDGNSRVARFSARPNNPNEADPDSELPILDVVQPFPNHNGGCIKFGPDGHLYIGFGDGGAGGDPYNNGQKPDALLGKMLRINVDSSTAAQPYRVPANNPFLNKSGYAPEIWSLGWRNPWRFSFDRLTGALWVGDVGQDKQEEINVEAPGKGGLNYGWRCMEGALDYYSNGCHWAGGLAKPVFVYDHDAAGGCSVTGGFVYRGAKYPDLYGKYVFTDYCTGRWWTLTRNADGTYTDAEVANLTDFEFSTLGEDYKGELYAAGHTSGKLYRLTYTLPVAAATPSDVAAFSLNPNPTQDVFELQLELHDAGMVAATLYNAHESILLAQNQTGQNIRMQFDLRALPAGTYYLKLRTPAGNLVKKVVKL